MSRIRLLLATLAAASLTALIASGPASAAPSTAWETPCGDVAAEPFFCSVIMNRTMLFAPRPGEFQETMLRRGDVTLTKGQLIASSTLDVVYPNAQIWSTFGNSGLTANLKDVVGEVQVAVNSGTLVPHPVRVVASGPYVSQEVGKNGIEASTLFGLTCTSQTYLACVTPGTWRDNRTKNLLFTQYPERFTGFATIESRPLIVKVINMTNQPLIPEGAVRVDNMLRSRTLDTPTRIDGLSATGRPGVGYYHLYRSPVRSGSVSLTYRFADGPDGETTLTRAYIDATVDVSEDTTAGSGDADGAGTAWSTANSKCDPPKSLNVSIECTVTVLGSADGVLQAVVVVNG